MGEIAFNSQGGVMKCQQLTPGNGKDDSRVTVAYSTSTSTSSFSTRTPMQG